MSKTAAIVFITSRRRGSLKACNSSASFLMAGSNDSTVLKISTVSATSFFIGSIYFAQARCLLSLASNTAFSSMVFNSSSLANALAMIHSFICFIPSHCFSHSKRSFVLYRSWLPEVEWPCGCVISSM